MLFDPSYSKDLRRISRVVVVLNMASMLGTVIVQSIYQHLDTIPERFRSPSWQQLLRQFNLASENTVVSWYSSMLLLSIAVLAFLCHHASAKSRSGLDHLTRKGWILLSILFVFLSLDELGSLHENAGRVKQLDIMGDRSWESVLAIPGGLVVLFMMAFAWFHLRSHKLAFFYMVVGVLLYITVPFQEHFEFAGVKVDDPSYSRPVVMVLLEEGAELFGSWALIKSMTLYIASNTSEKGLPLTLSRALTINAFIVLVVTASALFMLCFQIKGNLTDDEGVAINWFPSAVTFLSGVILTSLVQSRKALTLSYPLMVSVYFGIDFYSLLEWEEINSLIFAVRLIMITGLLYFGFNLIEFFKETRYRTLILISAVVILPSFFFASALVTVGVFVSGIILIGAAASSAAIEAAQTI